MKSKPKRRVLTAREKQMREKYTQLGRWSKPPYAVRLAVESQSFQIFDAFDTKREAEWMRDMLAVALSKIEL